MTRRAKIFWLLWVIIVLAAILFTIKASGDCYPTQGSGAYDLIRTPRIQSTSIPEPSVVITPTYRNFYFAAIATNSAGQSDFSNEAVYTRTNSETYVTLTCDPPVTNNVDGYLLYWGKASGVYTNQSSWGTNRIFVARIVPDMPSNLLVTVTTTNATNLVWSSSVKGPWSRIGAASYTVTNPIGPRYFRSYGPNRNSKVFISSRMQ